MTKLPLAKIRLGDYLFTHVSDGEESKISAYSINEAADNLTFLGFIVVAMGGEALKFQVFGEPTEPQFCVNTEGSAYYVYKVKLSDFAICDPKVFRRPELFGDAGVYEIKGGS